MHIHIQKLVVVQATWPMLGSVEMECNRLIWDVLGVEMIKLIGRVLEMRERKKLRMDGRSPNKDTTGS